jgi:hypothetical protein
VSSKIRAGPRVGWGVGVAVGRGVGVGVGSAVGKSGSSPHWCVAWPSMVTRVLPGLDSETESLDDMSWHWAPSG